MEKKNFVRKKVQSLTLGEKLRQLREDRQMRSRDLSRKINVKVEYIEALEMGDYDNLPIKVYVKGYVRSYARFFGISDEHLLNMFEREYSIYQNINKKDEEETVQRLPKVPKLVVTPKLMIIAISLLSLLFVGIYLYFSVDNFISSPWLVVETPVNGSVIESDNVKVEGETKSNSQVFVNDQQIFVDMDGKFSDSISLNNGLNTISVKSINKFGKESVESIIIDAKYEVEKNIVEKEKNVHIVIKSKNEPILIQVISDDISVYNDILEPDDEKTFDAVEKISVTTSEGKNTFVKFGEEEEFEILNKKSGIVRDLNFDVNGIVDVEEKQKRDNL